MRSQLSIPWQPGLTHAPYITQPHLQLDRTVQPLGTRCDSIIYGVVQVTLLLARARVALLLDDAQARPVCFAIELVHPMA